MPREAALDLAREKGLDLIEIGAAAKPPVAQIIGFDKFRYQKEKEFRKQRFDQKKTGGMKQVRISSRAAQNDLALKAELAEKFLQDGYKVEINLFLRGREKYNRDWARAKLNDFLKNIKVPHKITLEPRFTGRGFVAQLIK